MVRTTCNSQRAAAHAVPPSASRPASPYNFNTNPVPFPSLDALNELEDEHPNQIKPSEQQYRELPTAGRRRSTRQALKAIPNAPAAPPVAVTTNSNKDPSPPPFRRPPTGSRAKRHVLGDLMDPPPPAPTPSVASEEPADENDENAIPTGAGHIVPVPYNAKHGNIEPRGVRNPFWENRWRPVHRAQHQRPTEWEEVGYYQENEWDTDDEEYTRPTPRPRRPNGRRMPKINRDQTVLFEGVSFIRNAGKMAREWSNFKPACTKYIKPERLAFPALREGGKLKLVASNEKGQIWKGVKAPQKPDDSAPKSPQAKVYALPKGDDVDRDENGDPLPNPDIHPSTNLPTDEWLADNVDELAQEAKRAEEELEKVKQKEAYSWGKLMIENEDLAEDEKAIDELLERMKKIVPPDVFKAMVHESELTDMDDPENRFGPAKESPYDAYVAGLEALATQRQPTPPPRPVIASTACATSNKENTGPKPKPLTRATYQQKLALAKALTKLQEPSAEAKTKTRRKAKPRARTANVEKNDEDTEVEDEDGTDVEGDDGEADATEGSEESSDGEADEENEPHTPTSQVHVKPSSAQSQKSDSEDADDENESPDNAKKYACHDDQDPDNDNAAFDDFYSDEEKTWNPTRTELQAQYHNDSEDEDEKGDSGPAAEEAEEEPVKATTSKAASTFVVWKDGDASATHEGAEDKASAPKRAPLGPKRVPSAMPNRNLKRDRDEGDDEDSEGGDEENDENKDSWVPSKKRRVSGYYGANDENAPFASASQAEDNQNEIHEDDEPSVNRPLSPIFERPSSEERETKEIEELLSFIEDSPAGSPEPIGDTSFSVHLDGFGDDVEMSDESDEGQDDENAVPAPAAATFAPALAVAPPLPPPVIAPLLPSPVIVSSVRARRPRALGRDVVTVVGNRQIVYGQVFEDGKEV